MDTSAEGVARSLGWAGIGTGIVGLLAPKAFLRLYGMDQDRGQLSTTVRLFSTRNIVVGAAAVWAADADPQIRRAVFTALCAMSAVDTLVTLTAGSPRMRSLGTVTNAGFVAGGAHVLAHNTD